MIVYPQGLVAALAATPTPLTNPRIGWQNLARGLAAGAVSASSETATGPRDAVLRPDTAEFWQPVTLPATLTIDLGSAKAVDYVGVAGHTFGSCVAGVKPMVSSDSAFLDPYMLFQGTNGNSVTTPDSAALSITGNIDVRVRAAEVDWTPSVSGYFFAKGVNAGQLSYDLFLDTSGNLHFTNYANGTTAITAVSTVPVGAAGGATKWVRATRNTATGDVTFYTSDDYNPATGGGTWTQLGATVATAAGGQFDGNEPLTVGAAGGGIAPMNGLVYYVEIRSGIGGAVAAKLNPAEGVDGASSWVSGTGEAWTVNTSGGMPARLYNNLFSAALVPADDAPLLFLDSSRVGRYLRLTLTGTGAVPRVAVVYVGAVLAMEKAVAGGFRPITMSRDTVLSQSLSRGGQFLGQGFRRNGVTTSAAFKNLTAAWVRANFDSFSKSARSLPYFFAWNPAQYPLEVGYCWTDKDIVPAYAGLLDNMEVSWTMRGIGVP
jgi:hypothetical protein